METQPLLDQISFFLPRLLTAIVLLIVAFIIAAIVRALLRRLLTAARLDQRLRGQSNRPAGTSRSATEIISTIVFWIIILLFLPAILDALGMVGLLQPVQNMVERVLAFLPNLFAAALILVIGLVVAHLVRQLLTSLLAGIGLDRLGERIGLSQVTQQTSLSSMVGWIVYILILIPVITASLNALGLESVTQPISNVLNEILNALPNIFAAAVLLILAYVVARLVATLVTNLLRGIGFDGLLARIGLGRAAAPGGRSLSDIAGGLVFIAIMLFASIEAARLLGFAELATLISGFTVLLGQIVMGLIIFGIGLFLANVAFQAIRDSGVSQSFVLAWAARIAILVLATAMALRQMGLAPEIINLAFGLTLGAIAVATALAFGLGGQQVAGRVLSDAVQSLNAANQSNPPAVPPPSAGTPPTPPPPTPARPR